MRDANGPWGASDRSSLDGPGSRQVVDVLAELGDPGDVVDLAAARAKRDAGIAAAIARHPATLARQLREMTGGE